MQISRREFLGALAAGGVALARWPAHAQCQPRALAKPVHTDMRWLDPVASERFSTWLKTYATSVEPGTRHLLYNFYDSETKRGRWIYPMLAGKLVLWLLQRGRTPEAERTAEALLRWQQVDKALPRTYGAFPSGIESGRAGDRFYAGDNLVILEALTLLHARTKNARYLNSAVGTGTWLSETMCQGHKHGMWAEDHGAPMHFVSTHGDFSNQIHVGMELMWLSALRRLSTAASEPAYCAQAEKAAAFYRQAQFASGSVADHYDPGFPAAPYDAGRWRPYAPGQLVADETLRAALGFCRLGEAERAKRVFKWLKVEDGGVPAYLHPDTGAPAFLPTDDVYYDVVSSGLYRCLAQWVGERDAAKAATKFLRKTQSENGGWYWGARRLDLSAPKPEQAPIVGIWATADLSRPAS